FAIRLKGSVRDPAEKCYSPYTLHLYAEWVRWKPGLIDKDILNDDVDQFVQIRVLDRLQQTGLQPLLPAVAVLGRFDDETLRVATNWNGDDFPRLFRTLGEQEWVCQDGRFLVVDADLRRRMLAHFEHRASHELTLIRRRAAEHLRRKTLGSADEQL